MRLVFLSDIITPYFNAVFRALAERCDLRVIYCSEEGSRGGGWSFEGEMGFPYRVLGGAKLRRDDNIDLHVDPRILRAIAAERPDAIVAPAFSAPTAYAAMYTTAARRGLVIHSDGIEHSELGLGRAQMTARSVLLRAAGACAAQSRPAGERFAQLGVHPDKIVRANHTTRIEPLWEVARARETAANGNGRLRVLNVGRLIPRKRLDSLVEAVALARREEPGIELELVGSGPEEDALRRQAEELGVPAAFRGFVDQKGLPSVYAGGDVFVLPSEMDPFGIVVLEAAAAGMPVFGSQYAGATGEFVREGITGHVFDPDDPAGLARALVGLARDPERRRQMGREAHAATLDRTPEAAADGYLEAARIAVAEPRRARRPLR